MFAVLQLSCETKSITTNSTQFMVRTEEVYVLYFYTKFEAESSIRSKIIRGSLNFEIGSLAIGHAHLGVRLFLAQEGFILYPCTKFETDNSIRSKVKKGSKNLEIGARDPKPRPFSTINVQFV